MSSRTLACIGLLVLSNVFMNLAWYGHLKWFPQKEGVATTWLAVAGVILFSWALALPEYALQVPANRLGHVDHGGTLTAAQLKVMQEAITLVVFTGISFFVLKEKLRWQDAAAFVLIFAGVAISMSGRGK
ncbi:MAG TPA: DMT family protein [Phycisphaerales bacterium]|nr:DMT family protein [Phycisphaerales bacterium]